MGWRRFVVGGAVVLASGLTWVGVFRVAVTVRSVADELRRAGAVQIAPRPQTTVAFDRKGREAFTYFVEQRIDVPLAQMSPRLIDAVISIEDRRFFQHHGIDPFRIAAAAYRNLRAGRIVEGGSTITQQLARAVRLSPVRTYNRKLREILVAAQIETHYTKARILEEYLNTVYLGEGYYGVEAASRGYFRKSASEVDVHEAALIAALIRSPSSDAPSVSPARATKRRNLVLRLMRAQGRITGSELTRAMSERLPARERKSPSGLVATGATAPGLYFQEEVRRQLLSIVGARKMLRGGLRVFTTYDPAMQRDAEAAVTTRIAEIVKRRPAARDLQGSFVAMDPVTGDVRALVGGRDFTASSFNRATQARRQAGSAFKPIIYAAALERGYAPGTLLRDLDVPLGEGSERWLPSGEHEAPEYTVRAALKVSSNRAAAQLLQQVGVSTAVYYAQRMGITSPLPQVPSLALGTGEVTLLELTSAYTALANAGRVAAPRIITRVEDASGAIIYESPERHVQAVSPTTAFLMSSMLAEVIGGGTGSAARHDGFKLPAAGKTGTTDDYADAWFVGYTPHLVAGVWFGLDRPAPIMRGGFAGVVAVPAWARFMRAATAGDEPDWYATPADVERVAICRLSGERATDACRHHAVTLAAMEPAGPSEGTGSFLGAAVHPTEVQPAPTQTQSPVFQAEGARRLPALRPGETPVYEDLFPLGTVAKEPCALHNAAGTLLDTIAPRTTAARPQPALARAASDGVVAVRSPAVIMDRVTGADGVQRIVLRQVP